MEYGAIDLHKKESQIRVVTKDGQVLDQRIATTRERLTHVFWGRPRMPWCLKTRATHWRRLTACFRSRCSSPRCSDGWSASKVM